MMGRILVTIVLCVHAAVLGTCAHAQPITVGVHIGSLHFPNRDFNNVNPGLYVRDRDWQAGAYLNSYRHTTAYAGYVWKLKEVWGPLRKYEMFTGGATGYGDVWSNGPIAPMVVFSYRFETGLRLSLIPPTPKNSGVLHLSKEF